MNLVTDVTIAVAFISIAILVRYLLRRRGGVGVSGVQEDKLQHLVESERLASEAKVRSYLEAASQGFWRWIAKESWCW